MQRISDARSGTQLYRQGDPVQEIKMAIIIEDAVAIVNDQGEVMFLDTEVEEIEISAPAYTPAWD